MDRKEQQENLHAKLFGELERALVKDRFERLKSRFEGRHGLPARDLEQADTPYRLLHLLKRDDKIRIGDYKLLKEALKDVGETDLVKNIEESEKAIRKIGSIDKRIRTPQQSTTAYRPGERKALIHDGLLEDLARDTTITGEVNEMDSMRLTATDWLKSAGCSLHADDMRSPKELFEQMERSDIIRIGNYDKLKDLFRKIHRTDKVRKIEEALKTMKALDVESKAPSRPKRRRVRGDGANNYQEMSEDEPMDAVPSASSSRHPSIEYKIGRSSDGKSGLMIIFNMFTEERAGTLKDSERLKNLFEREFNFVVKVYKNKPKADVLYEMASIREDIEDEKYPQLFYVMLSHGDKDGIWTCRRPGNEFNKCKDEQMTIEEILTDFTGEKSRQLSGLPKVFLIQACRGHDYQESVRVDKPGPHGEIPEVDVPLSKMHTPVDSDFLVAYSQTKGYVSFRNAGEGSWFIQTLCDVFEQNYKQHHVLDMMTMVNKEVAKKRTKDRGGKDVGQISCQVSTFRNNLYLC